MAKAPKDQLQLPWTVPGASQVPASVVLPAGKDGRSSNYTEGSEALLAPAPQVDRFPVVIGNALSLSYITSTYRLATQGWRWQAVDVWNELLEHDPHARGVVRQRLLPVVAARLDVLPAELDEDAEESEKQLVNDIAKEVRRQLRRIPARTQALGRLAWGIPYGMSAAETEWERDTSSKAPKGWEARGLHFIHSRRLNVTDSNSWDVYIYDQGPVAPWSQANYSLGHGLRLASFPGKFILHCPALSGDYATRDGELRYIGVYLALKRMIVRCSAQDFERVIRPWVLGFFNREADKTRQSVANTADINQLLATVKSLGLGSLNSAVLPESVRVEILKQVASAGNPREFADWLDRQVTESLLGQTYTTGPQHHGTHEAADTAQDGTRKIHEYDAQCLCDSLERDLVYWIVALNWSHDIARQYAPTLKFAVSEQANSKTIAEVAKILTSIDVPLKARSVGTMCGMPVIDEGDDETMETGRTRIITGGKDTPIEPDASNDPNSPDYKPPVADGDGAPATATRPKPKAPAKTASSKGKRGSTPDDKEAATGKTV